MTLETFFRDPLSDEVRLMYWDTMRERCSIRAWEYACTQIRGDHDFHTVPLPAKLMPWIQEYREEERRRQVALEWQARQRLLPEAEPSRDPSFRGTEAERRAWAAAQQASLRAQLEARWNATDGQEEDADAPLQ